MKKLSLLVALILCVTIGGVYATWTYVGETIAPHQDPIVNKMGDVTFSGASGTYHVSNNTMSFVVEPKEGTYDTQLTASGTATLNFAADPSISDKPLKNALCATITVVGTDLETTKYNGTTIYTLDPSFKITLDEDDWTQEGNNYSVTLNAADLLPAVTMADFNLPSHDDYLAFQNAQKSAVFRINIAAAAE